MSSISESPTPAAASARIGSFACRQLGQDGKPDSIGKLTNAQPFHHARPMHLDRAHADAKFVCDHLVLLSRLQRIEHFALARTEYRNTSRRRSNLDAAPTEAFVLGTNR
jgi:hypothetical protein